jgi:hypothetical protein
MVGRDVGENGDKPGQSVLCQAGFEFGPSTLGSKTGHDTLDGT